MVFSTVAFAQEWTRFRGPNGQGQCSSADTIPVAWTEADYNWKVELPGTGNSSPVVWQDHVYVLSADPESGARFVSCLSATTGKAIWKQEYPTGAHFVHKFNSFASSTPAADDKHVYVAWATPDEITLLALTHAGKEAWKKNLGAFQSQHGFGTSPIVVDSMVILVNDQEGDDRFIVALDSDDGKQRWKIPRKHATNRQNLSYSTPCVRETSAGRELIICSWAHGISSHDLQTGAVNWEIPVFKLRPVGSPVLVGDLIFGNCGEGSGNSSMVAIKPSEQTGTPPEIIYTKDRSIAPYVTTLCAAGDLLFLWGDKGIVSCLDAASGEAYWTKRVGGNFFGSPVRAGNRIYCMSSDGDVVVIEAAKKYKLLAKNSLGEGTRATPAIAGGRMYLRTDSHLISLGGESMQQTASAK
ncbi:MAG: PQQ-binding-like beta-propeller repeat protein [Pirellulales bacterium]|nr:PQQ-binding-like beta-propeller repeat protein [Pirellulales bacterium]